MLRPSPLRHRRALLLEPRVMATAFALAVVTAPISSILPALKASRMKIVDPPGHV